jgi:hypothetical protein
MGGSKIFRKSKVIQLLDDHNYVLKYFLNDGGFDELVKRSGAT